MPAARSTPQMMRQTPSYVSNQPNTASNPSLIGGDDSSLPEIISFGAATTEIQPIDVKTEPAGDAGKKRVAKGTKMTWNQETKFALLSCLCECVHDNLRPGGTYKPAAWERVVAAVKEAAVPSMAPAVSKERCQHKFNAFKTLFKQSIEMENNTSGWTVDTDGRLVNDEAVMEDYIAKFPQYKVLLETGLPYRHELEFLMTDTAATGAYATSVRGLNKSDTTPAPRSPAAGDIGSLTVPNSPGSSTRRSSSTVNSTTGVIEDCVITSSAKKRKLGASATSGSLASSIESIGQALNRAADVTAAVGQFNKDDVIQDAAKTLWSFSDLFPTMALVDAVGLFENNRNSAGIFLNAPPDVQKSLVRRYMRQAGVEESIWNTTSTRTRRSGIDHGS